MEAIALQRGFENLGLQLLFAPIRSLLGRQIPNKIPEKKRQAVVDLKRFLDNASAGIDLMVEPRKNGFASLATLDESVKAERAYRAIHSVIPSDAELGKEFLNKIKMSCDKVIEGRPCSEEERKELYLFCRDIIAHLDRERFEYLRDPRNICP